VAGKSRLVHRPAEVDLSLKRVSPPQNDVFGPTLKKKKKKKSIG